MTVAYLYSPAAISLSVRSNKIDVSRILERLMCPTLDEESVDRKRVFWKKRGGGKRITVTSAAVSHIRTVPIHRNTFILLE